MNEREKDLERMRIIKEAEIADCEIYAKVENKGLTIKMMGNPIALSSLIPDIVYDLIDTAPDNIKETIKEAIMGEIIAGSTRRDDK